MKKPARALLAAALTAAALGQAAASNSVARPGAVQKTVPLAATIPAPPALQAPPALPLSSLPLTAAAGLAPGAASSYGAGPAEAALAKAAVAGVGQAAIARAIGGSADFEQAARALGDLGIIGGEQPRLDTLEGRTDFEYLLHRLWDHTSPSLGRPEIDASYGVPALVVKGGDTTYFVHAVAHGQLRAPQSGLVRGMARALKNAGLPLYSEQNLPAYYGFSYGSETVDHEVTAGPSRLVDAARGAPAAALAAGRWLEQAAFAAAPAIAAAWAWHSPGNPLAWLGLAAGSVFLWLAATSMRPWLKWTILRHAAAAEETGQADLAAHLRRVAAVRFKASLDLAEDVRLELPMPLRASLGEEVSARSSAIAGAVRQDAAAMGAKQVHVLVGHRHVPEVAWRLLNEGPSGGS